MLFIREFRKGFSLPIVVRSSGVKSVLLLLIIPFHFA